MLNYQLLHLVETILGNCEHKKDGNYAFSCPKCSKIYKDGKKKLEIDLYTTKTNKNYWHCWRCDYKGTTLKSLFKSLHTDKWFLDELGKYVKYDKANFLNKDVDELMLPKEYVPLHEYSNMKYFDKKLAKESLKYLNERNISEIDIVRYNIGICSSGKFNGRMIFPSYNKFDELNMFTSRVPFEKLPENIPYHYLKPVVDESKIIPFENQINYSLPIILCEGVFDAIAIKHNAIPLLGKTISSTLKQTLLSERINDIYICLDKDAKKKSIQYVEMFYKNGKNIFFVELDGKDPSKLGYEETWKCILNTSASTFKNIVYNRMKISQ